MAMTLAEKIIAAHVGDEVRAGQLVLSDVDLVYAHDLSGPPLAMVRISETVAYFVVPFLITVLFFAGPASTWYEVVFWVLKVLGVFILLAVGHVIFARVRTGSVRTWLLGAGSLAIIASLEGVMAV